MTRRIILSLNKNRAFFYLHSFFHLVLHSFSPDTGSTPISFSASCLLQFATAAENLTFSTKLIFCKTILGNKSFLSLPLRPFLSLFLHFQALRWFALIAFICLLVCFSWLTCSSLISGVLSHRVSIIALKNHYVQDTT